MSLLVVGNMFNSRTADAHKELSTTTIRKVTSAKHDIKKYDISVRYKLCIIEAMSVLTSVVSRKETSVTVQQRARLFIVCLLVCS
jgi:hypothetical protein